MSYFTEVAEYWRPHIVSKLIEQKSPSLSDADIEQRLGECCGGVKMVEMAKQMRDANLLNMGELCIK